MKYFTDLEAKPSDPVALVTTSADAPSPGLPPMLDYEAAKDFFYTKLSMDRTGRGRMESAYYHTAQWIFLQGCTHHAELTARIALLEAALRAMEENPVK
jgi:hypothetical protein